MIHNAHEPESLPALQLRHVELLNRQAATAVAADLIAQKIAKIQARSGRRQRRSIIGANVPRVMA